MQAPANDDQISLDNRFNESNDNDDDNVIVHRAIHHDNNLQFGTHHSNPQRLLIDNRQTVYIPIQLRCGVTVMCHQDIFRQLPPPPPQWFHQIRTILQTDVSYCLHILPVSVRSFIRRTKLWLNVQNYYYYDPQTNQPIYVNHTTTHHHVAWLQWYVYLAGLGGSTTIFLVLFALGKNLTDIMFSYCQQLTVFASDSLIFKN